MGEQPAQKSTPRDRLDGLLTNGLLMSHARFGKSRNLPLRTSLIGLKFASAALAAGFAFLTYTSAAYAFNNVTQKEPPPAALNFALAALFTGLSGVPLLGAAVFSRRYTLASQYKDLCDSKGEAVALGAMREHVKTHWPVSAEHRY